MGVAAGDMPPATWTQPDTSTVLATLSWRGGSSACASALATGSWADMMRRVELVILAPPLVTGVLGFLTAWFLQRRNGRRVRLAHQIATENLVRGNVPLEVSYAGNEVQQPQLLTATFRNLGPRDIEVEDFQGGGIGMTVAGARIVATLDCTVGNDPIKVAVDHDTGRIEIPALLIPQGAAVKVQILAADRPAKADPTIRLRQVTAVPWENQERPAYALSKVLAAGTLTGMMGFAVGALVAFLDPQTRADIQENPTFFLGLLASMALATISCAVVLVVNRS